jgi:foldase protein PrsA
MIGMRRIACALCLTLGAALGIAACGSSNTPGPDTVVAQVDGHTITKGRLEHWTAVEAVLAYEATPKSPVPKGVVPDPPVYANCVSYLGSLQGHPKVTQAQLKRECKEKYVSLQRHVLDILLIYHWLEGESSERGLKLTDAEINQIVHQVASTPKALQNYLSITGESLADLRLIAEKDLYDSKLLELDEREFEKHGLTSPRQHEQALVKAATELTQKWSAKTSCLAGYVISDCKQFKGTRALVAP